MAKSNALKIALAVPIVILIGLSLYRASVMSTGIAVEFPVTGFDPRDLLSGHYIQYTVDYGNLNPCRPEESHEATVCMDGALGLSAAGDGSCQTKIVGRCVYSRFTAGIERFYIPDTEAKRLDEAMRKSGGKIGIRIPANGHPQVEWLEINGERF